MRTLTTVTTPCSTVIRISLRTFQAGIGYDSVSSRLTDSIADRTQGKGISKANEAAVPLRVGATVSINFNKKTLDTPIKLLYQKVKDICRPNKDPHKDVPHKDPNF